MRYDLATGLSVPGTQATACPQAGIPQITEWFYMQLEVQDLFQGYS